MVNAAGSPTFYEFDSTELLAALQGDGRPRRGAGRRSTTPTPPPRPTRAAPTSAWRASPDAHYVLVSTREHGNNEGPVEFRSYRIVDGEVTEEEVAVVDPTADAPAPQQLHDPQGASPHGHRGPDPDHPAHLHRRREGRRRRRRARLSALIDDLEANHPGIKDRLHRRTATCAASSTSTSTTRTSASSAASRPSSATATRSSCCPPSPAAAEPRLADRAVSSRARR